MANTDLQSLITSAAFKVSKYGVFSCPNTGKYGPEKTPFWDTFHAVISYHPKKKQQKIQSKKLQK